MIANEKGHPDIVAALKLQLDFLSAAEKDTTGKVEELLKAGANINAKNE